MDGIRIIRERYGRVAELAKALGIRRSSIYTWKKVPAERVLAVERITGIPRHELRPDVFPAPSPLDNAA